MIEWHRLLVLNQLVIVRQLYGALRKLCELLVTLKLAYCRNTQQPNRFKLNTFICSFRRLLLCDHSSRFSKSIDLNAFFSRLKAIIFTFFGLFFDQLLCEVDTRNPVYVFLIQRCKQPTTCL